MTTRRPPQLRRSFLFVPGADRAAHTAARTSSADVIIQELEDFTPPARRPEARALAVDLFDAWRRAGAIAAVRINPLESDDGPADLAAIMRGRPDIVLMPKIVSPEQVVALDRAIGGHERALGLRPGSTEVVPNVETAAGLVRTAAIVAASPRVTGCLVASEDMAADLGAERSRDGIELAYVRARFLVECTAAGVPAIDCPYTFSDVAGLEADTRYARRLGYKAKSCVKAGHASVVNRVLTPSADEVAQARRLVAAFATAREAGQDRVELDGALVEVPIYRNAERLIARATALAAIDNTEAS
ncbi:MAG: CoA ester lyase [Proteobacteria bacterium]|nr:CoA ester lyase [Pseudomonadota bacterium]